MDNQESLQPYKSGFLAVVGRPNVGKSSLINRLLGQKIAAVSPKPQTTRRQQLGILTLDRAQIILVDTPGIHLPHHLLGEHMNREAEQCLEACDLALWVVDGSSDPTDEDEQVAARLQKTSKTVPMLLGINKMDRVAEAIFEEIEAVFRAMLPTAHAIPLSALLGTNLDQLLEVIISALPEGEPYYPEDQLTDAYERDLAADLIRESALLLLYDEVPHSIAVRIDEFSERGDQGAFIAATLFVERESQKPIVIGRGGSMIKAIGTSARKEIESMSGRKIFLELNVKTRKDWRNDRKVLLGFGFRFRED